MFVKFDISDIKLAAVRLNLAIVLFLKNPLLLKVLPLLQFLPHIFKVSQKHSQKNYKGPLEAGFLKFPPKIFLITTRSQNFIEKLTFKKFWKILNFLGVIEGENQKSGF